MKIAEIFYSIQGEGALVGVPSVFVRTSGCNLRCVWCDTPYTSWRPEGSERSIDSVVSEVSSYPASHVVVTGGEPMIAPEIVPLTTALKASGLHITVETAGTVYAPVACDLMSISPKLSNSTPRELEGGRFAAQHERLRYRPGILKRLMGNFEHQFKFVVASPCDIEEVRQIANELGLDAARIILMPEGIDREIVRERGLWVAEECKQYGYRFSPRLHIDLWGDRRGV